MLRLSSKVVIGPYTFSGVTEVEVVSSWDHLTDTAIVTFPRKVSWQGQALATGADPLLKRGMAVSINLGYDGNNTEVFRGYVRDVSGEIPVRVQCEDAMYLLKKGSFNASYRSSTSAVVVSDLLESAGLNTTPVQVVSNTNLGQFRVSKATPAKVLQYLREHYFVRAWFREGTLYVGAAYVASLQRLRVIRFDRSIISHNLEYRIEDDVRLALKAVIVKPDNSRTEVEVGDPDGEKRTFHYYNVSKSEATKMLEAEMVRLRYTGYRGEFETFGAPDIRHGDIVRLVDPVYPDRAGEYLVKSVKIKFGGSGYRQNVELEQRWN